MNKEQKELLTKELCERLPYGLNVAVGKLDRKFELLQINAKDGTVMMTNLLSISIDRVKPYLRPLSSMTNKERDEYYKTLSHSYEACSYRFRDFDTLDTYDWYKRKHFDYRGMIPMGLAYEAPADMYEVEKDDVVNITAILRETGEKLNIFCIFWYDKETGNGSLMSDEGRVYQAHQLSNIEIYINGKMKERL